MNFLRLDWLSIYPPTLEGDGRTFDEVLEGHTDRVVHAVILGRAEQSRRQGQLCVRNWTTSLTRILCSDRRGCLRAPDEGTASIFTSRENEPVSGVHLAATKMSGPRAESDTSLLHVRPVDLDVH